MNRLPPIVKLWKSTKKQRKYFSSYPLLTEMAKNYSQIQRSMSVTVKAYSATLNCLSVGTITNRN